MSESHAAENRFSQTEASFRLSEPHQNAIEGSFSNSKFLEVMRSIGVNSSEITDSGEVIGDVYLSFSENGKPINFISGIWKVTSISFNGVEMVNSEGTYHYFITDAGLWYMAQVTRETGFASNN